MTDRHIGVLEILTKIGCVVSIFLLLLSALIFSFFRSLASLRNTIHINLCLNLATAQLIFIFTAGREFFGPTGHRTACAVAAGAMLFFFLSSFCWMLLEGVELYLKLVRVFETPISLNAAFFAFGYGAPALFLLVAAPSMPGAFGDERTCWLTGHARLLFVIPVILILLVNFVIFFLSFRVVSRVYVKQEQRRNLSPGRGRKYTDSSGEIGLKSGEKSADAANEGRNPFGTTPVLFRKMLYVGAVFASLLGTPWVLGFFYHPKHEWTVIFAYLFIFFNAFQGLFIFVFNCALNETVQSEIRRFLQSSRGSYNTGSTPLDPTKTTSSTPLKPSKTRSSTPLEPTKTRSCSSTPLDPTRTTDE